MSNSTNVSTSYADLALFSLLTPLSLFLLYNHGRPGILGWSMLFLFCSLRLIGAGLAIGSRHDEHPSKGASVIQSIGLSPLILACAGVAAELWHYVAPPHRSQVDNDREMKPKSSIVKRFLQTPTHLLHLAIHVLVLTGVALSASSASRLASSTASSTSKESNRKLYKAGSLLLLLGWIVLLVSVIHTLYILWTRRATISPYLSPTKAPIFTTLLNLVLGRGGSNNESGEPGPGLIAARLAVPVFITTAFAGERTIYAVFVAFSEQGFGRLASAKQGERWLFTWADVTWAAVFLVAAGLWTRGLRKGRKGQTLKREGDEEHIGSRTIAGSGAVGVDARLSGGEGAN
ncbi:MAG: hypothetical protein Q9160_005757 [Pyrenula sp. 1 TL-2023]